MTTETEGAQPGFWNTAAADPDRVAVINPDGSSITYGELEKLVNQLSHALLAAGLGRESTVAVVAHNHHVFMAMNFATGQIGGYCVPVNWHFLKDEMAHILADSGTGLVVAGPGVYETVTEAADEAGIPADMRLSITPEPGYRLLSEFADGYPDSRPDKLVCGMFMGYTSGTTGHPKGVKRPIMDVPPETFMMVMAHVLKDRYLAAAPDVFLLPAPMYHAAPNGHATEALYYGNTLVLMDRWDSEEALALIDRHKVTNMFVAPIHLARWLALPDEVRAKYDVSSIKQVMHAGAPCPVSVKYRAIEWLGPILYEYYGGTEGAFTSVTCDVWLEHPGTVGNVHDALPDIKVLDEETGEELPAGEIGLLYSKFPGLEFAYHNDPEKTTNATADGGFVTLGDVGYVDEDGWLFMSDRRTDMILSGGVNIYPAEIESLLLEHPAVGDAAVVGVPDEEWGNRLMAFIEPAPGISPGPELADELATHCRAGLAKFKCPQEFEFRSELPRSGAGKLLRRVLRDELAARTTV